ncbi:molybdopterin-dependent oxidoreductase, partial [Lysobacter sp. TAB13]|uniref:molybdopterin-dependent oxidoreductase n=1 Tax=Lysobacter sp. TAB13 TaxID=3233065 RepID=UPI003F9CEB95
LLNPGASYRYNGQTRTYPEIKLVYWAGGNPFHHQADDRRLRQAFARLDTLVVHELAWTATARHADIVLPCTMTLEREDIGGSSNDPLLGVEAAIIAFLVRAGEPRHALARAAAEIAALLDL